MKTEVNIYQEAKAELERIRKVEELRREETDPTEEAYDREPLSVTKTEVFEVLLSWGGPSDGFKLYFRDKELYKACYFHADWGTYQEHFLTDEEAQEVFDHYFCGEYPEGY